jgi:hypothetical protein
MPDIIFRKYTQHQHQNVCGLGEFQMRNQILSYVHSKTVPLHIVYMPINNGQEPRVFVVTIIEVQYLENSECNSNFVLTI